MSAASRFNSYLARTGVQRTIWYGLAPVALAGFAAAFNVDKLDTEARAKDHSEAQIVAKDLQTFVTASGKQQDTLVEAYNTRKAYLGTTANNDVGECMKESLVFEQGGIEIAQTSPSERLTSYRPPMATELLSINGPAVAVMNFNQARLRECADQKRIAYEAVPTAEEARTSFYWDIAKGLGIGLVLGGLVRTSPRLRRSLSAPRPPGG